MKTILFIGPHGYAYEIVAEQLGVTPLIFDSEAAAIKTEASYDGIVSGYVGRSSEWFKYMISCSNSGVPSVIFSGLIDGDVPKGLPVIEKGLGSGAISELKKGLGL